MGLLVTVYKYPGVDASNNGISSKVEMLCLVNVEGPFVPKDYAPAALLVKGNVPDSVKIVPCDEQGTPSPGWYMHGGNYAATSDSRLGEAVRKITNKRLDGAIAIHDRKE